MPTEHPGLDPLLDVLQLKEQGLFGNALVALERLRPELISQSRSQALRAELLERVGRRKEAETVARKLLSLKNLSNVERSLCDFVLARIDIDAGNTQQAIESLNRSIRVAELACDSERKCVAQLKLFVLLSDHMGTDATAALLADLRATAARTGNRHILASVHVYFAQIEALRGSIQSARRHIALANKLLVECPNAWLESVLENISLGLAIMTSEFGLAEAHAEGGCSWFRERAEQQSMSSISQIPAFFGLPWGGLKKLSTATKERSD